MIALKFLSYSSVEYNFGSISISSCSDTCLMGGPSAGPACDSWQGRRESQTGLEEAGRKEGPRSDVGQHRLVPPLLPTNANSKHQPPQMGPHPITHYETPLRDTKTQAAWVEGNREPWGPCERPKPASSTSGSQQMKPEMRISINSRQSTA